MRRVLALPAALLAALVVAAPATAYDVAALRSALAREMRAAGPSSGAIVRDLDSGQDLFAVRADTPRIPASIEKLYTTATALLRMGPRTTLETTVVSDAQVDEAGVLHGDLVLVGGGDPFFGTPSAGRLAAAVRDAGIARIDGAVVGDESTFDRLRSGCCRGYDPDLGGVLSALAYDRGVDAGKVRLDAARFAAVRFAAQLKAAGVRATRAPRAGIAPPGAGGVALEPSLDVRTLTRRTTSPPRCSSRISARATARAAPRAAAPRWSARPSAGSACARAWSTAPACRDPIARVPATSCACSSAWTVRTSPRRSARRSPCPAGRGRSSGACAARPPSIAAA